MNPTELLCVDTFLLLQKGLKPCPLSLDTMPHGLKAVATFRPRQEDAPLLQTPNYSELAACPKDSLGEA
jgi:hypothetical protein